MALESFFRVFLAVWAASVCGEGAAIKVGSFNADVFGKTKFSKGEVVETLYQIVLRYDIILFMEISDSTETMIYSFLDGLNGFAESASREGVVYDMVISERLGRTSRKEQYAYFYRSDIVEVLSTYQFYDENDAFAREPYGVLVSSIFPDVPPFFLLALRTDTNAVVTELNLLDNVYDEAVKFFETPNGVILGDLRADCSYLSRAEYLELDLNSDRFVWMIGMSADTTTTDTNCAYDRIIIGADLVKNVIQSKVEVFKFSGDYGLTYDQATEVSDHYPVGLEIEDEASVIEQDAAIQEELRRRRSTPANVDVLRLAAFNIQVFGTSKINKPEVVQVLSMIVRRYDITLIQEIRDSSETVIHDFLETVNRDAAEEGVVYDVVVSGRLGRTTSKEQYAYLYRTDTVELTRPLQHNDTSEDVFEREPYSIFVRSRVLDIPPFFLVGIHVSPNFVTPELNQMDEVFAEAVDFYGTGNGIILGDLNADCSYLSRTRYNQLDLVLDNRFMWLINSSVDTTTKSSDCAYDRFIVAGDILSYIVQGSALPFRYDLEYELDQELTEDVSDHYPIETLIEGSVLTPPTSRMNLPTSIMSSEGQPRTLPSTCIFVVLAIWTTNALIGLSGT